MNIRNRAGNKYRKFKLLYFFIKEYIVKKKREGRHLTKKLLRIYKEINISCIQHAYIYFPFNKKKKIYSNYHYQKVSIKSNQFNISTTFIQQMSIYTSKSYTSNNFAPIITFDQKSFSSKLFPHAYLFPSKWNNSGIKRWTKKIFDRYSKTFCRNEISRHQDDSERSERRDTGWRRKLHFFTTP